MIAHRIAKRSDVADDYTRLAEYIAAAPEQGEKLDRLWIANCDAGETPADLAPALAEIEAVRQKKPAVADKTYHLVVSFRAEDRPGLTGAALKDMARTYAEALGFGAHQYVAGTHINTDHFHMHIAINKVHPETLKVHTPYRDFKTLEQTSRALEQRYGLSVDRGRADRDQAPPLSPAARDFEAATWEESFQRWLQGHRDAVLKTVADSRTWPDLHRDLLDRHGVRLKARGAGLVFTDRAGGQAMKASALDRACARAALERRLGPFRAATAERAAPDRGQDRDRGNDPGGNRGNDPAKGPGYRRKPLLRAPGVPRLWRAFRKGRADTLARRTLRNWKHYLLAEAWRDPYAAALVLVQQEALHVLFGPARTPSRTAFRVPRPVPPSVAGALAHWRQALPWRDAGPAPAPLRRLAGPGVRVDDAGHRVIPFQGRDGRFAGVRLLARDGKTLDLAPGRGRLPAEALHVIAPDNTLPESGPVVVAGDHALGVALARATRAPVAVAAEAAALPAAARALRARHPAVRPVLVTTRDGPPMTGAIPQVTVDPGASTGALRDALADVLEDRAWQVWRSGRSPGPEDRHPLLRVGQLRRGARLDDAGNLLLPLRDAGLRIDGVQVLDPRGRPVRTVTNRPDTPLGHVLGGWVGTRSSSGPLVITDSLDAAVALHRETRATVVQAARGTEALARALRRRFPDRPMLVADDAGAGDTRAVTITRAIGGQLLPLLMTDRQALRQALTRAGLPPRTRAPARPRTAAPAPSHRPN